MNHIRIIVFLSLLGCPGANKTKTSQFSEPVVSDAGVITKDAKTFVKGHTDIQNGIGHKAGKEDPLKKCSLCHGKTLTGRRGPSCYTCHSNKNHDSPRRGVLHRDGSSQKCVICHGPNNTGGLGPPCVTCHK